MTDTLTDLETKARNLVPDVDEKVKKLKKSGKCLSTFEALNHIIRLNSRETVGSEWFNGFWVTHFQSRKGAEMGFMLIEGEARMIFFEKKPKKYPKRFAPVRIKVKVVRNIINNVETYEHVKTKKGHLSKTDLLNYMQTPRDITERKFYMITGKIRYINQISFKDNQRLKTPLPIFDRDDEGNRTLNLRLALSDLERDENMVSVTLKGDPEKLAIIYGVKYLKMIDHFKKVPNEDEKLSKLKDALITKRVIAFGNGSNKLPFEEDKLARQPYLSMGNIGFVIPYSSIFKDSEMSTPEQDFSEDVAELPKKKIKKKKKPSKKIPKIDRKKVKKQLMKIIKSGEATKKRFKRYGKKNKVPSDVISEIVERWLEEKRVMVKGDTVVLKKKKKRKK